MVYLFNKLLSVKFFKRLNAIVIVTMALLFVVACNVAKNSLIIYNIDDNNSNAKKVKVSYDITNDDFFSVEFIHSVNKSPVIEYYKIDKEKNIYIYKTIYYNYGAGVPTELSGDETLSFGDDGSMIIDNINKKIDNLTYYLSDLYDHVLRINDGEAISLWKIFGKNQLITIEIR